MLFTPKLDRNTEILKVNADEKICYRFITVLKSFSFRVKTIILC